MSADLKKRILSMFCCIVLLFGVCGNVYAATEQPDVSIHVGTEESKLASFSVGAEHPWFVRCGIPSGQKK